MQCHLVSGLSLCHGIEIKRQNAGCIGGHLLCLHHVYQWLCTCMHAVCFRCATMQPVSHQVPQQHNTGNAEHVRSQRHRHAEGFTCHGQMPDRTEVQAIDAVPEVDLFMPALHSSVSMYQRQVLLMHTATLVTV